MPLDDALLARARTLNRPAAEELFAGIYPSVHRIAHALAGREDVARGILRFVMSRAPRQLAGWRDIDAVERWFHHHTVLTARRALQHQPKPGEDLLVTHAPASDAGYVAFVRALRGLPIQQREAFILHHGEHLMDRSMAIAMDCSTKAAETHLEAATRALEAIAGAQFPAYRAMLSKAVAQLTPGEEIMLPSIRAGISQLLWKRWIRRLVRLAVSILIVAGLWYAYARFGHFLPWPALRPR